MASLKKLSQTLDVSVGFLKNITKNKKSKDDFLTSNTANCCRAIARYTGYSSKEKAEKAIRSNVKMLYVASDTLANRILKLANKYGEVKKKILKEAALALKSNNFQEYNRLIKSNKELSDYKRKCAKSIKKELIEKLRSAEKSNTATARTILISAKSPNGYKIVVPRDKIEKEIQKRLKRYGAVASLFWQSAKKLNPKIRPDKLPKEKRKKHKMTNGMSYKAGSSNNSASAVINHRAEKMNSKFKAKLLKRIAQQEKFWSKQAEKQIIAAGVLNKLIEKV